MPIVYVYQENRAPTALSRPSKVASIVLFDWEKQQEAEKQKP